jgi:hypothetical protein
MPRAQIEDHRSQRRAILKRTAGYCVLGVVCALLVRAPLGVAVFVLAGGAALGWFLYSSARVRRARSRRAALTAQGAVLLSELRSRTSAYGPHAR